MFFLAWIKRWKKTVAQMRTGLECNRARPKRRGTDAFQK
jgi:hypothetical protein